MSKRILYGECLSDGRDNSYTDLLSPTINPNETDEEDCFTLTFYEKPSNLKMGLFVFEVEDSPTDSDVEALLHEYDDGGDEPANWPVTVKVRPMTAKEKCEYESPNHRIFMDIRVMCKKGFEDTALKLLEAKYQMEGMDKIDATKLALKVIKVINK